MTNFIISFLILADKFFGKLKATPVKVLVCFFAFGGCFYSLYKNIGKVNSCVLFEDCFVS